MLKNGFVVRKFQSFIVLGGSRFLFLLALGVSSCGYAGDVQHAGSELHYFGSDKGSALFDSQKVHCMSRSGHIVSMSYKMDLGKSQGPNITFFVTDGNAGEQHLGFVPTGKSQHSDFFNAHAGLIPGLSVANSNGSWTLVFHRVQVQKPSQPGAMLTLDGSVECVAANALNL